MDDKIMKFLKKNYMFLAALLLVVIFHTYMTVNYDSVWFHTQLDHQSYMDYIIARYHNWTSRLLIETGLLFFTKHLFLWKIADIAVWMFMLYAITKLIDWNYKPQRAGIICILFFCYNIDIMNSAGWIATINNYIWPFACLCGLFLIVKKIFREQNVKWQFGILGIFLLVLACNQEQAAAAVFGILICCILYMFWEKRKISKWLWIYLAVTAVNLAFILTCPGNVNRKLLETRNSFPEFEMLSLWNKLDIGITSILHNCIFGDNYLFLIFLLALSMAVWQKFREKWKKCIALVPVVLTIAFGYFSEKMAEFVPGIINIKNSLTTSGTYMVGSEWSIAAILLYMTILLCVIWELIFIIRKSETDGVILLVVLGAGFGTRFLMGFSPTIWISGYRTAFFWQMALLIAAGFLWEKYLDDIKKQEVKVIALMFVAILLRTYSFR